MAGASQEGHLIILDPGHGGSDTGTRALNHLLEKNLNLAVAKELAALKPANYAIILTRDSDFDQGPAERAEIANQAGADLYISLHSGSGFSQNPAPCRIFYGKGKAYGDENPVGAWDMGQIPFIEDSMRFAEHLAKSLRDGKIFEDIRLEEANSMILAPIAMPAVVIEYGNLLSPQDALLLSEENTQRKIAHAIHRAISSYLVEKGKNISPSVFD